MSLTKKEFSRARRKEKVQRAAKGTVVKKKTLLKGRKGELAISWNVVGGGGNRSVVRGTKSVVYHYRERQKGGNTFAELMEGKGCQSFLDQLGRGKCTLRLGCRTMSSEAVQQEKGGERGGLMCTSWEKRVSLA